MDPTHFSVSFKGLDAESSFPTGLKYRMQSLAHVKPELNIRHLLFETRADEDQ